MWNEYFTPATLDEALALLAQHAPDARIIAGGTDLVIELERGVRRNRTLIDISRLPGLDDIRLDDAGWIHLGPLVTHNDVVASALCVERAFPLARACREVGAPQIRNRATIAGNLITASPANDTITPLMALGARVTLRSRRGERDVALADFYTGVRRTVMAPDEVLVDIAFPALEPAQCGTFIKLGLRRAQAISVVNCAVVLTFKSGETRTSPIERAAIALGAVTPVIIRAADTEAALVGHALDAQLIERAARLAQGAARPIDDIRASAAYRRDMVGVLVARALTQLMAGEERADWHAAPALLVTPASSASVLPGSSAPPLPVSPARIWLKVNGREYTVDNPEAHDKTLLRLLREDCGLIGTKEGCAEGECGACTVIMDGKAVMACLVPAPRAYGASIITIEGLAHGGRLHPLQQTFIDEGAVQCGYCTPGFIMSGAALLQEHPHPDEAQIKESISGNLCRCTGYYKILSAFRKAAAGATSETNETHMGVLAGMNERNNE
ncbi:MAG: FAD binding domain-containing protein [Chloroflexi bacterium]|nr:FAD binding domain-containing protein [Chloroflexota bacterium]MCL5274362.1 FAD binding domain-containing protein [Chloroflexota bacterium]